MADNATAQQQLQSMGYQVTQLVGIWSIQKINTDRSVLLVTGIQPKDFKSEFADRKAALEAAGHPYQAWNTPKKTEKYDFAFEEGGTSKKGSNGSTMTYRELHHQYL